MTREEAKELYTPKSTYHMKMHFIDKIYDDFESRTCESCKYAEESDTGYEYYCTKHNEYENSYMSCNKWEQK